MSIDNYICDEIEKIYNGKSIDYDTYNHCIIHKSNNGWVSKSGIPVIMLRYEYKTRSVYRRNPSITWSVTNVSATHYEYISHYNMLSPSGKILKLISSNHQVAEKTLYTHYKRICKTDFAYHTPISAWDLFRQDEHIAFLLWALRDKCSRYIRAKIVITYVLLNDCNVTYMPLVATINHDVHY